MPDEVALLYFSMPMGFIVPGIFFNECAEIWRERKKKQKSPFFSPLDF